jgi:hypothetical protein
VLLCPVFGQWNGIRYWIWNQMEFEVLFCKK